MAEAAVSGLVSVATTAASWKGEDLSSVLVLGNEIAPDEDMTELRAVELTASVAEAAAKRPRCEISFVFADSASVTGISLVSNAKVMEVYRSKPVYPRKAAESMYFAYEETVKATKHGDAWRCLWRSLPAFPGAPVGIAADALRLRCLRIDPTVTEEGSEAIAQSTAKTSMRVQGIAIAAIPASATQRASLASTQAASQAAAAALAMTIKSGPPAIVPAASVTQPTPAIVPAASVTQPTPVIGPADTSGAGLSAVINPAMPSALMVASVLEGAVKRLEAAILTSEQRLSHRLKAVEQRLERIERVCKPVVTD